MHLQNALPLLRVRQGDGKSEKNARIILFWVVGHNRRQSIVQNQAMSSNRRETEIIYPPKDYRTTGVPVSSPQY